MLLFSTVVLPELLVKCVHRSIKMSGAPLIVRSLCSDVSACQPSKRKIDSQIVRAVVAFLTERKDVLQALSIN